MRRDVERDIERDIEGAFEDAEEDTEGKDEIFRGTIGHCIRTPCDSRRSIKHWDETPRSFMGI